jgi:aryl-alcohol dehydrogenase-like predicted oxidoreductase
MIRRKLTRRQMLLAGMAGLGSLVAARDLRASPSSGAAAAAAGTLTIGGDLTVNRMGFGAMRLTGEGIWGEPKDPAEARRVLRRAVDLGVNFIDTADAYGPEVNERLIAETLHPYPRGLVIATKGGQTRPSAGQWVPDGRPEHLREACEGSLKRLKLERIDLYQFHWPDPKVPVEDSVGELARLRTEGKIRHVGVSNFSADELQRVRQIVPIASVQNRYNVADRASEDVLTVCTREGIAFIPWAPIARGSVEKLVSDGLEAVAKQHAVSVFQVAIAWLLAKSPVMLPIPGTSSVAHVEENVAAARLKLGAEDLARLG